MDIDVIKQIVFSLIRTFGSPLIVWLATTGKISESEAASTVIAIASVLIAIVWSIFNKVRAETKVETALELPAGSSKDKLRQVIANQ